MAQELRRRGPISILNEADAEAALAGLRSFGDIARYPHPAKMYGIGYWIKKRFHVPQFVSLDSWELLHYPPINNAVRDVDKDWDIPFLLYNKAQKESYDAAGKTSLLVGSSFLHCKDLEGFRPDPSARGTLAFPSHSTLLVDSVCDWDLYADALLALPERFQPVSVCLYFKEILDRAYRPFLKKGMPVYCAGHMLDDMFPSNFYSILRGFRYSTSNMVGTSAYYSVDFGIPFFIYGPEVKLINHGGDASIVPAKETTYFAPENSIDPEILKEFKMFSFDVNSPVTIPEGHRAYVAERVGADNEYDLLAIQAALWARYLRLVATAGPRRLRERLGFRPR